MVPWSGSLTKIRYEWESNLRWHSIWGLDFIFTTKIPRIFRFLLRKILNQPDHGNDFLTHACITSSLPVSRLRIYFTTKHLFTYGRKKKIFFDKNRAPCLGIIEWKSAMSRFGALFSSKNYFFFPSIREMMLCHKSYPEARNGEWRSNTACVKKYLWFSFTHMEVMLIP